VILLVGAAAACDPVGPTPRDASYDAVDKLPDCTTLFGPPSDWADDVPPLLRDWTLVDPPAQLEDDPNTHPEDFPLRPDASRCRVEQTPHAPRWVTNASTNSSSRVSSAGRAGGPARHGDEKEKELAVQRQRGILPLPVSGRAVESCPTSVLLGPRMLRCIAGESLTFRGDAA
jgi:hypothetical protein